MTLTIPDDILKQAGLTEADALLEFACWLFDADRLPLPAAARLAGLESVQFEIELARRGIPAYRPTLEDLEDDAVALAKLRGQAA